MSQNVLRRRVRIAALGALVASGTLFAGGHAANADDPKAACGKDWRLLTIDETVQYVYDATTSVQPYRDAAWFAATRQVFADFDQANNDDGYLCAKRTGATPGQDKQFCGRLGYPVCFDYNVTNVNDNNSVGRLTV